MKRVQAACIYQTLIFKQKDELGLSADSNLSLNRSEVEKYKASMDKNKTRYLIDEETELSDGSILVRVRKQYNDSTPVDEYFN